MAKAFLGLSLGTMFLLVAAAAVGFSVEGHARESEHVILSIFAALIACLVHVVTFTYFTATGKMIRQAVFIGGLDMALSDRVGQLKKAATRPLGLGVFSIVVAVAVGGFMAHNRALHWLHAAAALGAIYANGWAFLRQYRLILNNAALMEQAMGLYNRRKADWRGASQNSEFKIREGEPPIHADGRGSGKGEASESMRPAQDSLQP